ncbi:MAG: caspase family protein, partial [Planctomycetes bacterium]|nr:caspase family protein [Planctomycetota bacterium]
MSGARMLAIGAATALLWSTAVAQARGIVLAQRDQEGRLSAQVEGERYTFGSYHALLISVQRYQRPFAELKTPHRDTQRLQQVLREHYGFSRFTVLQDQQATRAGILQAIGAYRSILGDHDNLLIYFAGHGLKQDHGENEEGADYYWVPYDGTKEFPSWVAAVELRSLLRNIRARHTVLISDSCFSGGLLRGGVLTASAPKSVRSLHRKPSCQVFTSGGLEPVEDSGRDGCSLFAYHLTRRLEANDNAFMTLRGLAHAVTGDVSGALESRQVPELGPVRGARHEYGDFVFFRVRAPGARGARPVRVRQEGVPVGWVLPPGVERTPDGRFFSRGRDAAEMVLVEGARYLPRGSRDLVKIDPFLIDRFEVTNARLEAFLGANPRDIEGAT